MLEIIGIDHVAFTAEDVERAADWYREVFEMERRFGDVWTATDRGDPVVMCNGTACVALFRKRHETTTTTDPDAYNRHFALAVDHGNFEQIQERLSKLGISFKFWDHKICHSLYLVDPDNHQIEITTYEL